MNNKFTEREKGFEKKFAKDEELQFKIQARSNKYIAEFVSEKFHKNEDIIKLANTIETILETELKRTQNNYV